ncbi:MAG: AMP-binding protein [Terracidiphilus sp.]
MRDHLATLLDDFRRFNRQIAVVRFQGVRRRATTYGEIARLAGRFASLLTQRGIGPGDRVLLWGENSAEWVGAFYGCILRGVLAVPLDAYGTVEFAARVAVDVKPKLVVGDTLLLRQLSGEPPQRHGPAGGGPGEWPRLAFEEWPSSLPAEEAAPVGGLSRETPLQILFTSGTTGDPKGVVLTHGNVLASIEPIERGAKPYMRYEKPFHPLRFLETLPLSHVFGQTMGLWMPAIFAAEVHFENRLVAARLIETIKRERISVLAAVPRVMALLKTHLEAEVPDLAERVAAAEKTRALGRWVHFRDIHRRFGFKFWALISGGGALAGPLEQFWNRLGFVVVQGYGMTETSAIVTLNHPFHVASGTIGKPLPGREVKLGPDGEVLVRGEMISRATWSGGQLQPRKDDWLATGDLAETSAGGDLRFLGRKSEVIVTSSGVNLHPEDMEAAIDQEPGVAACAVVPMETGLGPEPCAVLAFRGSRQQAGAAIERANTRLAEFQRLRHWQLWPEPDLPRTSTGKVRRKAVAAWLAERRSVPASSGKPAINGAVSSAASGDWLLALVVSITGEAPTEVSDQLQLAEDLHLDSLGRAQLEAALEERVGIPPDSGRLEGVRTLGELRQVIVGQAEGAQSEAGAGQTAVKRSEEQVGEAPASVDSARANGAVMAVEETVGPSTATGLSAPWQGEAEQHQYVYPRWPWLLPFQWLRVIFLEAVVRPLVWLLAAPRVVAAKMPVPAEPILIVANHVTAFDGPLVQYALPGAVRRRLAAAMAGDMLEEYRHFRNPERPVGQRGFYPVGPAIYLLLTALFNVFPLPRQRNFQRSFAHAGAAMDREFNVLVFPEGARSASGELARFRGGIGLLAKESGTAVLPVAIRGLGELKTGSRRWFRSGKIEVRVGEPIRFAIDESEAAITAQLHAEVARLLRAESRA